jgi:hypothetical protein
MNDIIFDQKPTATTATTPEQQSTDVLAKKLDDAKKSGKPADKIATASVATAPLPPVTAEEKALAPTIDLNTADEWSGLKDSTLRQVLTAWAQRAGVSLIWSLEYDYPLQTDVRIKGTFPDAVRTLLAGFNKAQPRPLGRLFKNTAVGGEPVLVVETQRLTN